MGGSYLTRYPDICNAILASDCKVLIITQNLASPYLNTADFILQCGTTNRNDVGKYAALMANDLIAMGYMRAYDKAFPQSIAKNHSKADRVDRPAAFLFCQSLQKTMKKFFAFQKLKHMLPF